MSLLQGHFTHPMARVNYLDHDSRRFIARFFLIYKQFAHTRIVVHDDRKATSAPSLRRLERIKDVFD